MSQGIEYLSEAVATHAGLSHLHLAKNGAGDKGVKALVEVLEANVTLRYLDLRSNAIGLTGARLMNTLLKERNDTIKGAAPWLGV